MNALSKYSINLCGKLVELAEPQVMGILNVTPDSFFADSRRQTEESIRVRARQIVDEGASIIDVGACSTKPGGQLVSAAEEKARLSLALEAIRRELPDAVLSLDTFRASIAEWAVGEFGVAIVNDVTGGQDPDMFRMVSRIGVPYVLTYPGGIDQGMGGVMHDLSERIDALHELGQKDVLLDPGFGFGKTLEENYQLLAHLSELHLMELPLLVGVSRKSMVYRLLGIGPEEALNGTTVLHTLALLAGAQVLRVHDVAKAVEVIKILKQCSCHSA